MERRFFYSIFAFLGIVGVTIGVIIYARGYRPDMKNGGLKSTGILVATSTPDGAGVYVDGELVTATDNTVNLQPGWYEIKIAKEGYIPWKKRMRIQGEIVAKTESVLFPTAPALRPLTTTGAVNPTLSADGLRLAYGVASGSAEKQGLWVYDLTDKPISFTSMAKQIVKDTEATKYSQADYIWSSDGKEMLVIFSIGEKEYSLANIERVCLVDANKLNDVPEDVTFSYLEILKMWEEERKLEAKKQLLRFKKPLLKEATKSAQIVAFSPDEEMVLYVAKEDRKLPVIIDPPLIGRNPTGEDRDLKKGKVYVYDVKEDKNYLIEQTFLTPIKSWLGEDENVLAEEGAVVGDGVEEGELEIESLRDFIRTHPPLFWYPDSRHLVYVDENEISIIEYDNTNKATVYAGPFDNNYVYNWGSGKKLVILTDYNRSAGSLPNLYLIDLK